MGHHGDEIVIGHSTTYRVHITTERGSVTCTRVFEVGQELEAIVAVASAIREGPATCSYYRVERLLWSDGRGDSGIITYNLHKMERIRQAGAGGGRDRTGGSDLVIEYAPNELVESPAAFRNGVYKPWRELRRLPFKEFWGDLADAAGGRLPEELLAAANESLSGVFRE